jgi:hypothetical protein
LRKFPQRKTKKKEQNERDKKEWKELTSTSPSLANRHSRKRSQEKCREKYSLMMQEKCFRSKGYELQVLSTEHMVRT